MLVIVEKMKKKTERNIFVKKKNVMLMKYWALLRTCCVFPMFRKSRLSTAAFLRVPCSQRCLAAASDGGVREVHGSDRSSPPDTRFSYSCSANTISEILLSVQVLHYSPSYQDFFRTLTGVGRLDFHVTVAIKLQQ